MSRGQRSTGPKYRRTYCDRCNKVKDDCIWVRPDVDGRRDEEHCLCGDCRKSVNRQTPLVNIDGDFGSVAVA